MHHSKSKVIMNSKGLQLETVLTPWLRFCIGLALLMIAMTPLVRAVRWW